MTCSICKNPKIECGTTVLPFEREWAILLITDIPAQICVNCGEAYIKEETAKSVQELARKTFSGEISYANSTDHRKIEVLLYAA